MIDDLCDEPCEEDIAVAMFYCDFRDQREQTATNIIGAILKQLVIREEVLEHLRKRFQKAKKEVGGRGLRLPDMVQMLKKAVIALPQVYICIDALDECPHNHLLELLTSLKDILQGSRRTRIFITGRPQVEGEIKRHFTNCATVPISPKRHDIRRYLEKKLEMDTERDAMSDCLRADILRIIPERISEMCVGGYAVPTPCMTLYWLTMVCRFLLASLAIGAILGEVTVSERKRKLNEMTKGKHLGDAYAATLDRMKAQQGSRSRLGMEALIWVSNSERPLQTSELCHALGVKIGSIDLDLDNVPTIRTLLGCSLGLITVEASSNTVRLVHITLQQYLFHNPSLIQSPHSMMAEICLTYLNFRCVWEILPTLSLAPSTVPFVKYASCYWGKHARKAKTESVSPLALTLLIRFEEHISSRLLLLHYYKNMDRGDLASRWLSFTGLHGAASLGIPEIVAALLAVKAWNINLIDITGQTALSWAVVGGYEDVVKILLQLKDVNLNVAGTRHGRTPLWWAAQHGHEGVVRMLLERGDIDPNTPDTEHGRTPLWLAVQHGHGGVVRMLLERKDINPNTGDTKYSRTLLWRAAQHGHEGVVRVLLERDDIDPNTPDTKYGRTPLWLAVQYGHERVVMVLLERGDINPNTADTEYGQTPLSRAAQGGNEGVVKLLLGRQDINPNTGDTEYDLTPLWWAVAGGHEGVIKLLLEREDINPNTVVKRPSCGLRWVDMRELLSCYWKERISIPTYEASTAKQPLS